MTTVERYRVGEPAPPTRGLERPEWAAYWPPRALTAEEQRQLDLDVEILAWADEKRARTPAHNWGEEYEAALADALDRADLHGWRRHLLLAIQARLGDACSHSLRRG